MNFDRIDFVKHRIRYFLASLVLIAIGAVMMALFGLHFGVDFKAGTSLDIEVSSSSLTMEQAMSLIQEGRPEGNPPEITIGGEDNNRVSARFDEMLSEDNRNNIIAQFEEAFGQVDFEEHTVDTEIAKEFAKKAMIVVAIASLGIILYVSIRFEWRFALAAVTALFHDALIVLSIFAIFRIEFNLEIIAAILTIIGYSINDTIVLFDRIRENLRKEKVKKFDDLAAVVNNSIRQTMTRSINTVVTILIPAVLLMILGSEAIRNFSLAMVFGLTAGAYSSIFLAAQLWLILKKNTMKKGNNATAN